MYVYIYIEVLLRSWKLIAMYIYKYIYTYKDLNFVHFAAAGIESIECEFNIHLQRLR